MSVRTLQHYETKNAAPINTNNESGLNNRDQSPTDHYITESNIGNGEYRKCFNLHLLEIICTMNHISTTGVDKIYGGVKYGISSVDGNTYPITLFTNKIWDIILLKLTELVHYDAKRKQYMWDDREEWFVSMSIQTITDCLGISDSVDSLTHLYDRITAAAKVLQNIRISINNRTVDGYLGFVGVRDCSDTDDYITKSNAYFSFVINPQLIEYMKCHYTGLYYFDHRWLYLTGHNQNAYAAAKRLGKHYSQNTYERKNNSTIPQINIGTFRQCLPCLNCKDEKKNRSSLDNALQTIPGVRYAYSRGNERFTFEELKKLKLRKAKYDKLGIVVEYDDHPNTSDNKCKPKPIKSMNNDALYFQYTIYELESANEGINRNGRLNNQI